MKNITHIISDIKRGKMVILVDHKNREDEGDLLVAAEKITPKHITFMAKFGRGLICVPMTHERALMLDLPPMTQKNTASLRCNFTVSVDAKKGVTTGISAFDRAKTIRTLLNSKTKSEDLARPGHVFPLVAKEGGIAVRAGHTEGSIDLLKLAGMKQMAVICEIMGDDGYMLRGTALQKFADEHGLSMARIQDVEKHVNKNIKKPLKEVVHRAVETVLPTEYGEFNIFVYKCFFDQREHVALVKGTISPKKKALVRVHSECLTGDVFHSVRCDCNRQLLRALDKIGKAEMGVLVYLRQEGRGIGLVNKLKAYNLQDKGYDTVEANEKLGFSADAREFDVAAAILKDIGVKKMQLLTNNPDKIEALKSQGFSVERIPIEIMPVGKHERDYLRTKKKKLGHLLLNI